MGVSYLKSMSSDTFIHPHFNKDFTALYKASLFILEDGCFFIVEDKHQHQIMYAANQTFDLIQQEPADVFYAQYLNEFLLSNEIHGLPFSRKQVFVQPDSFELIPDALFDGIKSKELLRIQINSIDRLSIENEFVSEWDVQLVTGISQHIHGVLSQEFKAFSLKHLASPLLRKCSYLRSVNQSNPALCVFVGSNSFMAALIWHNQLIALSMQRFGDLQEALYYLINVQHQQLKNLGKMAIYLQGLPASVSALQVMLESYFSSVSALYANHEVSIEGLQHLPERIIPYYQLTSLCE